MVLHVSWAYFSSHVSYSRMDTTMLVPKRVRHMKSGRTRNFCEDGKQKKQIRLSAGYKDCQVMKKIPEGKELRKPSASTTTLGIDHRHAVQPLTFDKAPKEFNLEAQDNATKSDYAQPRNKDIKAAPPAQRKGSDKKRAIAGIQTRDLWLWRTAAQPLRQIAPQKESQYKRSP